MKTVLRPCKTCGHDTLQVSQTKVEAFGWWDCSWTEKHKVFYCPGCGSTWEPVRQTATEDKLYKSK